MVPADLVDTKKYGLSIRVSTVESVDITSCRVSDLGLTVKFSQPCLNR